MLYFGAPGNPLHTTVQRNGSIQDDSLWVEKPWNINCQVSCPGLRPIIPFFESDVLSGAFCVSIGRIVEREPAEVLYTRGRGGAQAGTPVILVVIVFVIFVGGGIGEVVVDIC